MYESNTYNIVVIHHLVLVCLLERMFVLILDVSAVELSVATVSHLAVLDARCLSERRFISVDCSHWDLYKHLFSNVIAYEKCVVAS